MINDRKIDVTLDASGMRCPMPVLRLRRKLAEMQSGQMIEIMVTDENALVDIPSFCSESGHLIVSAPDSACQESPYTFVIKRQ